MKIVNRYYRHDFETIQIYEAGIVLNGAEVKSIKAGNFKLEQSFGKIIDGELFLFNAEIPSYAFSRSEKYNPSRKRKLLLHKKELIKIETRLKAGGKLTLVPESCYTKGRRVKISLALCRGRGEISKKKLERQEDIKRTQKQEAKEYIKQ